MATTCHFLDLPVELRLQIYEHVLAEHQRVRRRIQPSNAHVRLLYVCKQIEQEAGPILKRYISLLHEHQIQTLLLRAHPSRLLAHVEWADVANDGRVYHVTEPEREAEDSAPLSSLHVALARMTSLKRLRVFQCRQGLPLNLQSTMSLHRSRRLGLRFERAMFPKQSPALASYALHLSPDTRVELFDTVRAHALVDLRLSGNTVTPPGQPAFSPVPALRHLTLHGITGTVFDRHPLDECFPGARLESFTYALGDRLGFELRNHHLESLAGTALGAGLRSLTLLGCSRISSGVVTRCLESLPRLEHFALHLVTVDELRSNFVLALPPSLSVFKLQVINAWYAIPLRDEERELCEAIEKVVLLREVPLEHVCVCFRAQLLAEDGRQERWARIAEERGFKLSIGPWESQLVDEI
ncbi:hypothetical protein PYCCODRAFT_1466958 [Trametes coccinea BRFM310]|uniref:F-box domain-containing protein n=1 Tax=Trametes coccinea (strain BRFM310) TaxID=1353009 RepID=A0A1Y2IR27_TRAC3|nr:hypothetical protein PYCCODRAFT_1466958 [Trametes coccinea BRFM310]